MGNTRPSPMIQIRTCCGSSSGPLCRRNASTKSTMTSPKISAALASITHQSVAMVCAAGPAGSTAESTPLQPGSVESVIAGMTSRRMVATWQRKMLRMNPKT